MSEEIDINIKNILMGLVAGLIAAAWVITPYFLPGKNLFFVTILLGIVILGVYSASFKKKEFEINKSKILQSGITALVIFFLFSYLAFPALAGSVFIINSNPTQTLNTGNLKTATINVPNMFCEGCVYSVTNALNGIDGVANVNVSLKTKQAIFTYDPAKTSPQQIVQNPVIQGYGGSIADG